MKRKLLLLSGIVLSMILFTGIFLFYNGRINDHKQAGLKTADIKQNIKKRVFKDNFVKKNDFQFEGKVISLINDRESLVIIDAMTNQIVQLDYNGHVFNRFGKSGDAPWEIRQLIYGAVSNGNYYTFDRTKQVLNGKSIKGDAINFTYQSKDHLLNNMILLADGKFVSTYSNGVDFDFLTFDAGAKKNINKISIREKILKRYNIYPKSDAELVFEGYFSKNSRNQIVYSCNKAGLFFLLNDKGGIDYMANTIDNIDLPMPAHVDRGGGFTEFTIKPDIYVNYSRCIDNNHVYILSNILGDKYKKNRVIDVYDIKNGVYLYSLKIPALNDTQKSVEIAISNSGLLSVVYEDMKIVNYQINS